MITIALTYYDCPEMLAEQLRYWSLYSDPVLEQVWIVIVDDGSEKYPIENQLGEQYNNLPLSVYRIKQNIFQNTAGARNLAFKVAEEGWIFNTDIDHVVPHDSMLNLLRMPLDKRYWYRPSRRTMITPTESRQIWRHSDTFLLTKKMFWKIGGYNENLTEYYYNGATGLFRQQLKRFPFIDLDDVYTLFYSSNIIEDASPLEGKEKKESTGGNGHKAILNFDWEQLI